MSRDLLIDGVVTNQGSAAVEGVQAGNGALSEPPRARENCLHFEQVVVHRVPGRIGPDGGFALRDLSPCVTLIHGPNGSGKSTTALLLHELLWPKATGLENVTAEGIFRVRGQRWHIELDAGHAVCRCDGEASHRPEVGETDICVRYRLALDELLRSDDVDFARRIALESQGGFDLAAAAAALGFENRPSQPRKLKDNLTRAKAILRKARDAQQQTTIEATRLTEYEQQLEAARGRAAELPTYQQLKSLRQQRAVCEQLRAQMQGYPPALALVRGDEQDVLDDLSKSERRFTGERARVLDEIHEAEQRLLDLRLPEEGISPDMLRSLQAEVRDLQAIETEIRQAERERSEAELRAEAARRRLVSASYDADELAKAAGQIELNAISAFAARQEALAAQRQGWEATRTWLAAVAKKEESEDSVAATGLHEVSIDALRTGVDALARWLAAPDAQAVASAVQEALQHSDTMGTANANRAGVGRLWPLLAACLVIVVLAVVLAMVQSPLWLLAILVAAALVGLEFVRERRPFVRDEPTAPSAPLAIRDDRGTHRDEYQKLGLPAPEQWTADCVSRRLLGLARTLTRQLLVDERRRRLDELDGLGRQLQSNEEELKSERARLEQELGIAIRVGDAWVAALATNLAAWQQAATESAGKAAVIRSLVGQREAALLDINRLLESVRHPAVSGASAADAALTELNLRAQGHRESRQALREARRRLVEQIEPALEKIERERRTLLNRLALSDDQVHQVRAMLTQWQGYREMARKLADAEAVVASGEQKFVDRPDLLRLTEYELDEHIAACAAADAERERLLKETTRIRHAIETAKAGTELTDALRARDRAREDLAGALDQAMRSVAGATLASWVRQTAVESARPAVFRRANELLLRFTHGHLALHVDERSDTPALSARTDNGVVRQLHELSVGERTQVLMAVRLAFIEQHEAVRLPLLLDEALGTADDGRAGVIIDSVIEIARTGRQVFYFTAQHDEVGKWKARLETAGVPHTMIDLAVERNLGSDQVRTLEVARVEYAAPPAPEPGMDHAAYGRMLQAPPLDPRPETVDTAHIWHFLDDSSIVHLLLQMRIDRWGQLRRFVESGLQGLLVSIADPGLRQRCGEAIERARILARAAEAACEAWRIGRGKPLDRAAIVSCPAITPNFVDVISAIARDHGGDARAVLAALEGNEVKYWRQGNTPRVREYFEQAGFLTDESPLDRAQVLAGALAAAADALADGRLDRARVQRLVDQLPA